MTDLLKFFEHWQQEAERLVSTPEFRERESAHVVVNFPTKAIKAIRTEHVEGLAEQLENAIDALFPKLRSQNIKLQIQLDPSIVRVQARANLDLDTLHSGFGLLISMAEPGSSMEVTGRALEGVAEIRIFCDRKFSKLDWVFDELTEWVEELQGSADLTHFGDGEWQLKIVLPVEPMPNL